MVKFEFYLSDEDYDRMEIVKNNMLEKYDLTFNEFAEELLHKELYRLCPTIPTKEEE